MRNVISLHNDNDRLIRYLFFVNAMTLPTLII